MCGMPQRGAVGFVWHSLLVPQNQALEWAVSILACPFVSPCSLPEFRFRPYTTSMLHIVPIDLDLFLVTPSHPLSFLCFYLFRSPIPCPGREYGRGEGGGPQKRIYALSTSPNHCEWGIFLAL